MIGDGDDVCGDECEMNEECGILWRESQAGIVFFQKLKGGKKNGNKLLLILKYTARK